MKLVTAGNKYVNLDLVAVAEWNREVERLTLTLTTGATVELDGREARIVEEKLHRLFNAHFTMLVEAEHN